MPACLACSAAPEGTLSSPGRAGGFCSAGGSGGAGSWGIGVRGPSGSEFLGAGARRVEILTDAVERLTRVAGGEAAQLAVDAEARAEFHVAAAPARVEGIGRADGGPSDTAAEQVVDAAVAGADEALGRVHPAHRAAQVRTAAGDRDVGRAPVVGVDVDGRVEPAH